MSWLIRLGRWAYTNHWRVIAVWVLLVAIAGGAAQTLGSNFVGSPDIPASESATGIELLEEHFGGLGSGFSGTIVFRAEQGIADSEVSAAMSALFDAVDALDRITVVSPYSDAGVLQIAREGDDAGKVAYAQVLLDPDVDQIEAGTFGATINREIAERELRDIDGLQVEVGGQSLSEFAPPESEAIGVAFAALILTLALGSVLAMGLTIGVALFGVAMGAMSIGLMSLVQPTPDFAVTIGVMIGLGVGIDYALFIVTRYREVVRVAGDRAEAVGVAIDTAGRSVLFAGLTVVVSLLGMLLIGVDFVSGLGLGAAITVTIVMAASVTLLPAALGLAGEHIDNTSYRGVIAASLVSVGMFGIGAGFDALIFAFPAAIVVLIAGFAFAPLKKQLPERHHKAVEDTFWYRMSHYIQNRPWTFAIGTTLVLLLLSIPLLSLRLGFSDESNFPEETTTRRAYEMLADGFGPGSNGPLLLVAEIDGPAQFPALQVLQAAIAATDGVAFASPPIPNSPTAPTAILMQVQPTTFPQEAATERLVIDLRERVIPDALGTSGVEVFVTGQVAVQIDFTDFLGGRIILFLGVVLALSFLLLMAVFRSLLVPLKAVILNVLSISAAYGITVAIFQFGWGASLFSTSAGPIEPFIPMMLFAIVFGLSMDYEVFLLSRVKEEYTRTGDARESVAMGLTVTAGVITAAAAIMIVVFGSFLLEDSRIIKLFGTGLALAILIDATLVRMLLVPSTMQLLGDRNWWLPAWLDRILPHLNIEGVEVRAIAAAEATDQVVAEVPTDPASKSETAVVDTTGGS